MDHSVDVSYTILGSILNLSTHLILEIMMIYYKKCIAFCVRIKIERRSTNVTKKCFNSFGRV